jgi:hypothetical protein
VLSAGAVTGLVLGGVVVTAAMSGTACWLAALSAAGLLAAVVMVRAVIRPASHRDYPARRPRLRRRA